MAISAKVTPQVMHATSKKAAPPPSCTHTFDAWRAFAFSYSAQQSVSGRYGVDFRFAAEPTKNERRTLRLLDSVARGLGPTVLRQTAIQFDYVENANARAQENYPCASPGAHVLPSKSLQPSSQPLTQPGVQQTISMSSSATPRASPEHERFQVERAYQQQQLQDPFTDVFNFDLASPSEASAPPDTDVEPGNDTEGTDTESERELRLSDLEGPIALRRRGRGGRRVRAGSTSTNSVSSGPGISPVSPGIMRPNASAPYVSTMNANATSTSSLRPVYARRTSDMSPSAQTFPQTQLPGGISSFSTAVSETGVGIVGPGAGGSTSPNAGGSSIGLSAAARARMRVRGVGAPISEPDPDITPTNTAGVATVPVGGGMELRGTYDIGQYGYRYHAHPQYLGSASEVSAGHTQARTRAFPTTIGFSAAKDTTPSQSHASMQASNAGMNQQWQATSSTTATAGDYGMGTSMDIDMDMGGWGRISDPLPMDLCYGIGGMSYFTPYAGRPETQTQSQAAGTYQNQAYGQQQRQYPQSHQQQHGLAGAQLSYYTSTTTASISQPAPTVNPSLNMSPTKWKGNTAVSPPNIADGRQRAVSQSHVQGHGQRAGYWPTSDLRSEM